MSSKAAAPKVEKVEAYETTDFSLFKNKAAAAAHQNKLNLRECVENWMEPCGWPGLMKKSEVVDFMVENIGELVDELKLLDVV
jgi:hypothetical protein